MYSYSLPGIKEIYLSWQNLSVRAGKSMKLPAQRGGQSKREFSMKKKIALFLIMVMLVNMAVWADDGLDPELEGVLIAVAAILLIAAVTLPFVLAEADAPDDGIRLASMHDENYMQKTGIGSFLNVLQHIEVNFTQGNNVYVGLRFSF